MLRVISRFLHVFVLVGCVAAGTAQAKPTARHIANYKIATWNIAKLATAGRKMFGAETSARTEKDFANLRIVRDAIGADVYVLQEISSPAALGGVFPPGEFDLCLSGQWLADQKDLSPLYPLRRIEDEKIAPLCYSGGEALPDTPQPDARLRQYVAVAVRKASGIRITEPVDVPSLSIVVLDKVTRDAAPTDTVLRNLRWGLDVVLKKEDRSTRLLAVHQKSGCTDDIIQPSPVPLPDLYGAEAEKACSVVSRQLPKLKAWFDQAVRKREPMLVVGDFNRRLTLESSKVGDPAMRFWSRLTGEATPANPADDITIRHHPSAVGENCYGWDGADYKHAIDYFITGNDHPVIVEKDLIKLRYDQIRDGEGKLLAPPDTTDPRYPKGSGAALWAQVDAIADLLSDHCPRLATIR